MTSMMKEQFRHFAGAAAAAMAAPWAFALSVVLIVVWALTGPFFHFSDTWQLVINTGTTIITFLMVFLIQATQNRDAKAIHLKLDELVRSVGKARNALVGLENLTEAEIEAIQTEFAALRQKHPSSKAAEKS